ncbi:hypothetical protein BDV93DRAFT_256351 [Ceratobasidium sp. AG-I]|nr:hypothetical protein BDV93DRAFT_256351 [Ceratobasidium sp. AG-I]
MHTKTETLPHPLLFKPDFKAPPGRTETTDQIQLSVHAAEIIIPLTTLPTNHPSITPSPQKTQIDNLIMNMTTLQPHHPYPVSQVTTNPTRVSTVTYECGADQKAGRSDQCQTKKLLLGMPTAEVSRMGPRT